MLYRYLSKINREEHIKHGHAHKLYKTLFLIQFFFYIFVYLKYRLYLNHLAPNETLPIRAKTRLKPYARPHSFMTINK